MACVESCCGGGGGGGGNSGDDVPSLSRLHVARPIRFLLSIPPALPTSPVARVIFLFLASMSCPCAFVIQPAGIAAGKSHLFRVHVYVWGR